MKWVTLHFVNNSLERRILWLWKWRWSAWEGWNHWPASSRLQKGLNLGWKPSNALLKTGRKERIWGKDCLNDDPSHINACQIVGKQNSGLFGHESKSISIHILKGLNRTSCEALQKPLIREQTLEQWKMIRWSDQSKSTLIQSDGVQG